MDYIQILKQFTTTNLFIVPSLGGCYTDYGQSLKTAHLSVMKDKDECIVIELTHNATYEKAMKFCEINQNYLFSKQSGDTTKAFFNIPDEYLSDIDIIKKGQYSKVSDEYKKRVLDFNKVSATDKTDVSYFVLYKPESAYKHLGELFDATIPEGSELWKKFDTTKEYVEYE